MEGPNEAATLRPPDRNVQECQAVAVLAGELLAQAVLRAEQAYKQAIHPSRRRDALQRLEAARLWGRLQLARELLALVEADWVSVPEIFAHAWDGEEAP